MQKNLYLMVGIPGCGKSTFCKARLGEGVKWISRDVVRFSMITDKDNYFAKEDFVFAEWIKQVQEAINDDSTLHIFVDATHINANSRFKTLRSLRIPNDVNVIYCVFDTDFATCVRRNKQRTGLALVPDSAMRNMKKNFQDIQDYEIKNFNAKILRVNESGNIITNGGK